MSARTSDYACALILRSDPGPDHGPDHRRRRILLGRRAHFRKAYPGCWDVIGGRVEDGETHLAALTRELGEEIGIVPRNPVFFRTLEDRQMSPDQPPRYHFYRLTDWQGTPYMRNHEHSDLEWFTLRQACDLSNLALPGYRALFEAAMGAA